MKKEFHISDLIARHIKGNITPAEQQELDSWIGEDQANEAAFKEAVNPSDQLEKLGVYRGFNKERVQKNLEEELFGTKTVRLQPLRILRIAAAILMPLLTAGALYFFAIKPSNENLMAQIDSEVTPGSSQATLVLSNGEEITLDPAEMIKPIRVADVSVEQMENRVVYVLDDIASGPSNEIQYNELRTPRGGSFGLQLSDGTSVWLNAGSSLKFPVSFDDSQRKVILEGEGYFEVTHSEIPFIVSTSQSDVQVLGTTFNVSAYKEDKSVITTLVEGRVEVSIPGTSAERVILDPNEQAVSNKSASTIHKNKVDASGFISWRTGKFEFHNETLDDVMKKLSRWYDFEYAFEKEPAREFHFSARMDRDTEISALLEMLEMTTDVEFAYENGIIVVK